MKMYYLDGTNKQQQKKKQTHSEIFKKVHCKLQCIIRGKNKKETMAQST